MSTSPPSPAADPPEPDAMHARARALLRHLDHEQWRAEESYTSARKEAAESVVYRRERMRRITTGNHAEAVKELASLKIYQGMPELAKRDEGVDARWEQTLSEHRFRLVRAVAEYEGARRVAIEVGLIEPDEYPRWARPKSKIERTAP